ncbi:AraC family transcriptional regulator [Pedobacter sp. HMWF019]|uniref:AraC family transcriptional regulator n=1 Tax=Pedobacter sp. HMWF019 TaxID=2056856 RepID=UPI000D3A4B28|nr:AraC family transcriptional regulator [Pedobacter sp. HMWF019]PTS94700.1 AraC family transcriptional regulator [Pedobacter sp. HMWF019]
MKVLPFTIPVSPNKTIMVQLEELPYFYTFLHRHQEIQLTWVQEGEGTLVAGMNMHIFRSGEIYLFGANMPHLFKSEPEYFAPDSKKKIKAVTIFFNPKDKLSSLFDLPEMKMVSNFLKDFESGFKVPPHMYSDISGRILSILHSDGIDQLMQFLQLLKSLSSLKDLSPLTVSSFPRSINDNEGMRIASIYNYIIQNYSRALTLEEVAEQACMTPHAFCRYFKKHTRYTLVSFLNKVRINEACKMLTSGIHNGIASVAYSCGFNSITNFNRVFKSITGKSPRGYMGQY